MKDTERFYVIGMAALTALVGCKPSMPDMSTPPPPVAVISLAPRVLEQVEELMGRVVPIRVAEIRPQVTGIVLKRLFEQGSEVAAGQPLFQINPAPFKADVDTSAAALQRAEAVLSRAKKQVERLAPIVDSDAVSRQVYDDAVSQRDQAVADVAQARAELARRRLDLKFATVDAPIRGRIEQSVVSEGALVGPSDATPLARVVQLEQVYVDVRQPAASLEAMRALAANQQVQGRDLKVEILRNDGQPYNVKGRILFSGVSVDPGTGDVLVRLQMDNRDRQLLPGMFVRARITRARFAEALVVPQQAISRLSSQPAVWVLGAENKVRRVPVELGDLVGRSYRIRSGLKKGDQVIVEGLDRASEGAQVTPRPWLENTGNVDPTIHNQAVPTQAPSSTTQPGH